MQKLITILILSTIGIQQISACTCIGKSTIRDDIKNSNLIFKGKVLKKEIVTMYVSDTLAAHSLYEDLENKKTYESYQDFKKSIFGRQLLEYTIEKIKIYKGEIKSNVIKIRTGFGGGDCGYKFEINKTYLIFADNAQYLQLYKDREPKWMELKNIYATNICMRTKFLNKATKKEIIELEKL